MRYILTAFSALLVAFQLNAQSNLKVVLKDGSELNGYFSIQHPGKDITLTTSKAAVYLPSTKIKSIKDNEMEFGSLPAAWQTWAERHDAVSGTGDGRTVSLSDIVTDDGIIKQVRVLERGAMVKYLELDSNSYLLQWDTLSVIKCDLRPKTMLTGINRKYKLKSGVEYVGQYVGEVPGETLRLACDNGVIEVINVLDVIKDSRIKVNPNQTLSEQSDLRDVIKMKNGGIYRGIIYERNYFGFDDLDSASLTTKKIDDVQRDYLLIQLDDESTMSVNLSDIEEYRKEPNPNYKPLTDVLLKEGDFVVNRQPAKAMTAVENDGTIVVPADSVVLSVNMKGSRMVLSIESKFARQSDSFQYKMVKANKYQDKKTKAELFGFTYEKLAKKSIMPVAVETSVNKTTRLDFEISEEGVYVFYDPQTNRAIPIRVN